ncbi:hypothetical protein VUR80DRAFT_3108 [Thermomyces stellatus]
MVVPWNRASHVHMGPIPRVTAYYSVLGPCLQMASLSRGQQWGLKSRHTNPSLTKCHDSSTTPRNPLLRWPKRPRLSGSMTPWRLEGQGPILEAYSLNPANVYKPCLGFILGSPVSHSSGITWCCRCKSRPGPAGTWTLTTTRISGSRVIAV